MKDPLSLIDKKILQLKLKKENLLTNQANALLKDAQEVLGQEDFSIELALSILQSWNNSSNEQKEDWKKSAHTFRKPKRRSRKKTLKITPTNPES